MVGSPSIHLYKKNKKLLFGVPGLNHVKKILESWKQLFPGGCDEYLMENFHATLPTWSPATRKASPHDCSSRLLRVPGIALPMWKSDFSPTDVKRVSLQKGGCLPECGANQSPKNKNDRNDFFHILSAIFGRSKTMPAVSELIATSLTAEITSRWFNVTFWSPTWRSPTTFERVT